MTAGMENHEPRSCKVGRKVEGEGERLGVGVGEGINSGKSGIKTRLSDSFELTVRLFEDYLLIDKFEKS